MENHNYLILILVIIVIIVFFFYCYTNKNIIETNIQEEDKEFIKNMDKEKLINIIDELTAVNKKQEIVQNELNNKLKMFSETN